MARIVAVVATKSEEVESGGAPTFFVHGKEEQEKIAFTLEKIMDATAHDLGNGSYILVDHTVEGSGD